MNDRKLVYVIEVNKKHILIGFKTIPRHKTFLSQYIDTASILHVNNVKKDWI